MTTFCQAMSAAAHDDMMRLYHDTEYGFRITDDNALFERLALEMNQAGLSWAIILKRREGFRAAFQQFDIDVVAGYSPDKVNELLQDPGIIRNRRKVEAVIENARRLQVIRKMHGSFGEWLDKMHPLTFDEWLKLFKATFVFVGPEVVREFLMSIGYLEGAHDLDCPVIIDIATHKSSFM